MFRKKPIAEGPLPQWAQNERKLQKAMMIILTTFVLTVISIIAVSTIYIATR